jgi:fused signal recognition particle receptor
MFNFLKKKLKDTISKFSEKVKEEGKEEEVSPEDIKKEELESLEQKEIKKTEEKEKTETSKKETPKPTTTDILKEIEEEEKESKRKSEAKEQKPEKQAEPKETKKQDICETLPLSREEAWELILKHNKDKSDLNHYLESEAIMKALAKKLGRDEEYWSMLGLLHDVDWGTTKEDTPTHLTKAPEILKNVGFSDEFVSVVVSHGYGFDCAGLKDKARSKEIEHALSCSETITGLIHTYALMKGSVDDMKAKGLKKKFKDKRFAAAINRDIIKESEKLGLSLEEFFELSIKAVQGIKNQVGLGEKEEIKEAETKETPEQEQPEKKKFFEKIKEKITTTKIDEKQFEKLFWDMEVALLESNIAVEVITKIKEDIKERIVNKPIIRNTVEKEIISTLRNSLEETLTVKQINIIDEIKKKSPYVICFVGINGSGKTTTISKIASLLLKNNIKSILAAGDTWRKAAIEQLEVHGKKLNLPVVKQDYGADPAAVAYDAIAMAKARNYEAVLIDTAGRMHSNQNLMDELKKVVRIAKPDMTIFVGESITGNDCTNQAKQFNEAVGIDGIILSKADIDEKGGAAISISYITKKPILYLGTGQTLDSLEEFNKEKLIESMGL